MRIRQQLNATVCRDIVWDEVTAGGPISVSEMYAEIHKVFPATDFRVFCTALVKRDSGLAIINGVIADVGSMEYNFMNFVVPRHESREIAKAKSRRRK